MAASKESPALASAREHLSRAEAGRTLDGLRELRAGLGLLDEIMTAGGAESKLARTLASTYATQIIGGVARTLEADRAVPEPELERLFKVVLAFDEAGVPLPAAARAVKIEIARRLIDRYYEGHPEAEKQKAVEQLVAISTPKKRASRGRKAR